LKELYKVLKKRILVILVVSILAVAIGVVKSAAPVTYLYQSTSKVIIGANDAAAKTLMVIMKDPTVLDKVIKDLNLQTSSESLANRISLASIDGSQVVSISVIDKDPIIAAKIADTTAQVFKQEAPKIAGQDNIRLLSKAKVNPNPINKGQGNTILITIIIGLVLGIGLAFFIDSLDDSIRSEEEAEMLLGLPVLGKVSKINKKNVQGNKKKHELELRGETIGSK
jgi:capsular polysaccharide biosynthesis protein